MASETWLPGTRQSRPTRMAYALYASLLLLCTSLQNMKTTNEDDFDQVSMGNTTAYTSQPEFTK